MKWFEMLCVEFKGLPNGANVFLIGLWVGELLSINKVSSEHGQMFVRMLN